MRTLGLTATEWTSYVAALCTTHERRIAVELQTLDGAPLRAFTPHILDGQVSMDVTAETMYVLSMQLLDPSRSLIFEPDSPTALPLHRSRAIAVSYDIRVPALGRWVQCPVFHGPVWDMTREGAVVTLTAHSWDRQALGERWLPRAFAKKSKRTMAIRSLMADVGETRMTVPDLRPTFPARVAVGRMDKTWPRVRAIATSLDRAAFYDPDGWLRVRGVSSKPVVTFDGRWLLSDPRITRRVDKLRNVFEVLGAKPKGKPRVRETASIVGALSPSGLARHGEPHYLVMREENAHIKTRAEARARAVRLRDQQARGETDIAVDVLPFPPLDPYDLVHVVTDAGRMAVRARSWTLPLGGSSSGDGPGPAMTIGQVRRTVAAPPRRRR